MIEAKVVLDSICNGKRITTLQVKGHRLILPELNTHRALSKNAASSRAIPVKRMLEMVQSDPAMPVKWGKNQKGMSAQENLSEDAEFFAKKLWLEARDNAVSSAQNLLNLGLHKQIANRLLEPFSWTHVVITGTEFNNFFHLRLDEKTVQPEMFALANVMWKAREESVPKELQIGEWHIPYLLPQDADLDIETKKKVSAARCARVSYLNHDGTNPDLAKDIELHDILLNAGHMSPFEHQAIARTGWWANFDGWKQYRKHIPTENRSHPYTPSAK